MTDKHLKGPHGLTKEEWMKFVQQPGGLMRVASSGNFVPTPAMTASKGANAFSRALEKELQLPVELAAEPIVGWRMWNVTRQRQEGDELLRAQARAWDEGRNPFSEALRVTTRLTALGQPVRWDEPTMHATCEHPYQHREAASEAPVPDCGCGFWAFKERAQLAPRLGQAAGSAVYGTVQLWGRVIEHAAGYRAEYARPLELHVPKAYRRGQELVDDLADFYGCPAQLEDTRPGWLTELVAEEARRRREAEQAAWKQVEWEARNLPLSNAALAHAQVEKQLFFGRRRKR